MAASKQHTIPLPPRSTRFYAPSQTLPQKTAIRAASPSTAATHPNAFYTFGVKRKCASDRVGLTLFLCAQLQNHAYLAFFFCSAESVSAPSVPQLARWLTIAALLHCRLSLLKLRRELCSASPIAVEAIAGGINLLPSAG